MAVRLNTFSCLLNVALVFGLHHDLDSWSWWASQLALVVKNPPANVGDERDTVLIPGSGRSPTGEHGNPPNPLPAFLPGKSHGQRSLAGYSPRGHKELDMAERLSIHTRPALWHSLLYSTSFSPREFSVFLCSSWWNYVLPRALWILRENVNMV